MMTEGEAAMPVYLDKKMNEVVLDFAVGRRLPSYCQPLKGSVRVSPSGSFASFSAICRLDEAGFLGDGKGIWTIVIHSGQQLNPKKQEMTGEYVGTYHDGNQWCHVFECHVDPKEFFA